MASPIQSITPEEIGKSYDRFGNEMLRLSTTFAQDKQQKVKYYTLEMKHVKYGWIRPKLSLSKIKIYGCKSHTLRNGFTPGYSFGLSQCPELEIFEEAVEQLVDNFKSFIQRKTQTQRSDCSDNISDPLIRIKLKLTANDHIRSDITICESKTVHKSLTTDNKPFDNKNIHLYLTSGSTILDSVALYTMCLSDHGYSLQIESTNLYIKPSKHGVTQEQLNILFDEDMPEEDTDNVRKTVIAGDSDEEESTDEE